jgi:hypothetical protein
MYRKIPLGTTAPTLIQSYCRNLDFKMALKSLKIFNYALNNYEYSHDPNYIIIVRQNFCCSITLTPGQFWSKT